MAQLRRIWEECSNPDCTKYRERQNITVEDWGGPISFNPGGGVYDPVPEAESKLCICGHTLTQNQDIVEGDLFQI